MKSFLWPSSNQFLSQNLALGNHHQLPVSIVLPFRESLYKRNLTISYIWLFSISIIIFRFIYIVAVSVFIHFYNWIVFHSIDIPHFIYLFSRWWTFGLFPVLGYYPQCCYEHSCASICMDVCFQYSWIDRYQGIELLEYMVNVFNYLRNYHTIFQSVCAFLRFCWQYMRDPVSSS